MENALVALLIALGTAGLSAALVPVSRRVAERYGILDHPGERKIHAKVTPRLGGVAVFLAFLVPVVTGYLSLPWLQSQPYLQANFGPALVLFRDASRVEPRLMAVLAGAALAFLVGLVDDVLGTRFPVQLKAFGQVAAAGIVIASGVRTSFLPEDWMNMLVTLLWLVGMTNAFNLLDNMDGLSAGVAAVASLVFLVNAWLLQEYFTAFLLAAFLGALVGFLFYNVQPASVFLGDCGSLFIGFTMGSLTLLERYVTHASSSLFPVLMPVLVLAVPIVDTATVVFIRLREHRPIYIGDARHLSHQLVSIGFTKREAVLALYLLTLSLGLGAAALSDATQLQAALTVLQSLGFVGLVLMLIFVRGGHRVADLSAPAPATVVRPASAPGTTTPVPVPEGLPTTRREAAS